jgi:RecG-like helicase
MFTPKRFASRFVCFTSCSWSCNKIFSCKLGHNFDLFCWKWVAIRICQLQVELQLRFLNRNWAATEKFHTMQNYVVTSRIKLVLVRLRISHTRIIIRNNEILKTSISNFIFKMTILLITQALSNWNLPNNIRMTINDFLYLHLFNFGVSEEMREPIDLSLAHANINLGSYY